MWYSALLLLALGCVNYLFPCFEVYWVYDGNHIFYTCQHFMDDVVNITLVFITFKIILGPYFNLAQPGSPCKFFNENP